MENKLKMLFDYQKFEKNERLEKIISDTENYYGRELSDDELFFVNAAGSFDMTGGTISANQPDSDSAGWEEPKRMN